MVRDDIKIRILSKANFNAIMTTNKIDDTNVESFNKIAMISINEPGDKTYFKSDHSNVIRVFFHDIDESEFGKTLMSKEDAEVLFKFINKHVHNLDVDLILVHCLAGMSRSGGVGEFINDYIHGDYKSFMQTNSQIVPNNYIKRMLQAEANRFLEEI